MATISQTVVSGIFPSLLCPHCHVGILKESATTYTSHGRAYDCTVCKRLSYDIPEIIRNSDSKPKLKLETWFERDKREKNFFNLRKKKR